MTISRRNVPALLPGAWLCLAEAGEAEDPDSGIRIGVSESMMVEVNLSDARAAMKIRAKDLKIPMDRGGKLVYPSPEIIEGVRKSEPDAIAVNILEYRQTADLPDPRQVVCTPHLDQYVILASLGVLSAADLARGRFRPGERRGR